MEWILEVVGTVLLALAIVAVVIVLGYAVVAALAALVALLWGYWHWSSRVVEKCAGCWRCVLKASCKAGAVAGAVGAVATAAYLFSR